MEAELQRLRYRVRQLEREVRLLRNAAARGGLGAGLDAIDRYALAAAAEAPLTGSPAPDADALPQ